MKVQVRRRERVRNLVRRPGATGDASARWKSTGRSVAALQVIARLHVQRGAGETAP